MAEEAGAEEEDEVSEEVEVVEEVVSGLEPTPWVVVEEVEDTPADGNLPSFLTCSRDSVLYMTRNRLSSIRA